MSVVVAVTVAPVAAIISLPVPFPLPLTPSFVVVPVIPLRAPVVISVPVSSIPIPSSTPGRIVIAFSLFAAPRIVPAAGRWCIIVLKTSPGG